MTGSPVDGLQTLSMRELAVAVHQAPLDGPGPDELVQEALRRWDAAGEQQRLRPLPFGPADSGAATSAAVDAPRVEEARQFLGVQTLIHGLWLLQEADVEPADLFHDPATLRRVWTVIRREQGRTAADVDSDGEVVTEADPDADAIDHLVYWSRLALFGPSERLVHDQRRLAGWMRQDLFDDRLRLCREYLTQLRGPWSLEAFDANPIGLRYDHPLALDAHEIAVGLDVALGRPGESVTPAQVSAAHVATETQLAVEMARIAGDDLPEVTLPPQYRTVAQRQHLHQAMLDNAEFFTTAAGVASLAADRTVRVDGRPVSFEHAGWALEQHRRSVGQLVGHFGTVSAAGIRVRFEAEHGIGAVAVVDAAGTARRLDPDSLGEVMALITAPDALTYIARMRVGLEMLGAELTRDADPSAAPTTRTGVARRQRPGTPAVRHAAPPPGMDRRINGR